MPFPLRYKGAPNTTVAVTRHVLQVGPDGVVVGCTEADSGVALKALPECVLRSVSSLPKWWELLPEEATLPEAPTPTGEDAAPVHHRSRKRHGPEPED